MDAMDSSSNMTLDNQTAVPDGDPCAATLSSDDATWVLLASFIIFTMQSGFGLLESGAVNAKNQVNIMYKNATDVIFGGLMYWLVGYGLQHGDWPQANWFCGVGRFAVDINNDDEMGDVFVRYVFQLSFACTATTIVSGAMAERVKLPSYIIYAFLNPAVAYAIPAHWVWDCRGWLNTRGVVDIAGSGVVHLCGGSAALVAAAMLGPRSGRFDNGPEPPEPGCGTNIILGTFMLWWGWLGFNCGSTFGVQVALWKLAGKAAITTLNASMGGGCAGILVTLIVYKGKFSVSDLCNSVLGGLVAITAGCAVVSPWESIIIGFVGGFVAVMGTRLLDRCKIDDPLGAVSVHGFGGAWGMLAVGLFMREDRLSGLNNGQVGLFWSGNGYSLGIQAAAVASIVAWSMVTTTIVLGVLKLTIGIRLDEEEEHRGADATEHMIHCMDTELILARGFDKQLEVRRRSAFGLTMPVTELDDMSESSADGPAGGSHGADSEAPRARRRAFSISSSTLAEIAKEQRSHTNQNGHRNVAFQVDEDDNNNINPDGNTRL